MEWSVHLSVIPLSPVCEITILTADRNCMPTKITRNLYVSDRVDELHLVGASSACILRQGFDVEVLRGICDLGVWDL